MGPVKVVARYASGKVLKGFSNDFSPNKVSFHIGTSPSERGTLVGVHDLKALFFVKDFAGDKGHSEALVFTDGQVPAGRKAEVAFKDGEVLVGTTLGYAPNRPGFFLSPPDPRSNNIRVFVVSAAVKSFRFL